MSDLAHRTERFTIEGDVTHAAFPVWIARHASKLGLACGPIEASRHRLEFRAEGAPDMLDALEMGCSLGPIAVQVRDVRRDILERGAPLARNAKPGAQQTGSSA